MTRKKVSVALKMRPKIALSNIGLRVVSILALLRTLRKARIGNRGELSSVIRTGKLILRLVDDARCSDKQRAMDLVSTVEHLAVHWTDEIHRIV